MRNATEVGKHLVARDPFATTMLLHEPSKVRYAEGFAGCTTLPSGSNNMGVYRDSHVATPRNRPAES